MPVEWVAETDWMTCSNCGKGINPGEAVVGDFDRFFHKESDNCKDE